MLELAISEENGAVVARINTSRLDALAAPELRRQLGPRAKGAALLIIDLQQVGFVDSSGLGSLVSILKELPAGGYLRLSGVCDSVQTVLRITRLNRIFSTYPTVAEALAG
jgi:anti-sigma B factor antagonist